jgi:hypothetical protein
MKKLKIRKSAYLPHQYEFLTCQSVIKALVSGYGGGKTYIFLRECLKQHITNRRESDNLSQGWVLYPTLDMAQDLFVDEFKILLDNKNIVYEYSAKKLTFTTIYGKIKIYTLEKPERMVGANLTWCGIDEFDTARESKSMAAFKKVLGRLRGNNKACLFIVTTPEGFSSTYKIFVENASLLEDDIQKTIIHAKTTDNPYLPESYIKLLKSQYDERMLDAYLNGQFVNLNTGSVYYGFKRDRNVASYEVKIDNNLPLELFFDFNVFPMSAGLAQSKNEQDIRIIKEWVLKGHSSTWDMCNVIKNDLDRDHDVIIYGDASGSAKSSNSDVSDYQIIDQELGSYFRSTEYQVPKANIAVRNRVNCVNAKLQKEYIKINKDCVKLIKDFEQVTFTEKGDIDKSNIELTHISDACGYYIATKYPIIQRSNLIQVSNLYG